MPIRSPDLTDASPPGAIMRRSILSISAVSLLLLAGCSSQSDDDYEYLDESLNSPAASASPSASPTPEPVATSASPTVDPTTALANGQTLAWSGTFDIQDEDGYTADYSLSGSLSPFTSDVSNSKPGEFVAVATGSTSGTVTNTTAGRNMSFTGALVVALYPYDSAACFGYNGVAKTGGSFQSPDYCTVNIGGSIGGQLAPGESAPVQPDRTPIGSAQLPEGGDALAQMNSPLSVYAFIGNLPGVTSPAWTSSKGCVAPTQSSGGTTAIVMDGWPDLLCQ